MAPELREKKAYDGVKVDIFAIGVILFVIVTGRYPFQRATQTDEYYQCIYDGDFDDYWQKTID